MKRIAISGSPCSGKSTLIDLLKHETWAKDITFIPELATLLIKGGFPVNFADEKSRLAFQRAIYHAQYHAEQSITQTFLVDRALGDGAAYVGGLDAFRANVGNDVGTYDLVIYLNPPPEEAYSTVNNSARRETYGEALALAAATREVVTQAYGDKVLIIDSDSFITKLAAASAAIFRCIKE